MWVMPIDEGMTLKVTGITLKSCLTALFSHQLEAHPFPMNSTDPANNQGIRKPQSSSGTEGKPHSSPFLLQLCSSVASPLETSTSATSNHTLGPAPESPAAHHRLSLLCPCPDTHASSPTTSAFSETRMWPFPLPAVERVSSVHFGTRTAVAVVGTGKLGVLVLPSAALASPVWIEAHLAGLPVRELRIVATLDRVVHVLLVRQHTWEIVAIADTGESGTPQTKPPEGKSPTLQIVAHGEARDLGGSVLDVLKTSNSSYMVLFGGWPVIISTPGHSRVIDIRGAATAGSFIDEKHFLLCTHAPTGSQISVWAFSVQDGIKVKEKASFDTGEKIVQVWNLDKDTFVFSDFQCRIGWVSKRELLTSAPKLGWIPGILGTPECVWIELGEDVQATKPAKDPTSKEFGMLIRNENGYLETVGCLLSKEGTHSLLNGSDMQQQTDWPSPVIPGVPRAKIWGIIRSPPLAIAWDNQSLAIVSETQRAQLLPIIVRLLICTQSKSA